MFCEREHDAPPIRPSTITASRKGQRGARRANAVDLRRRANAESAPAFEPGAGASGLRHLLCLVSRGRQVDQRARSSIATIQLPPSQNGAPLDKGVQNMANEFKSFTCNAQTISYLEDVGTFDVNNPIEIRDNAAASTAFGADGFNVPSLLGVNYTAPYLHRGQAQTLEKVFWLHKLPAAGGVPIAKALTVQQQKDLLEFLRSIDGTTDHLRSEGDVFRDTLRTQGPCQ